MPTRTTWIYPWANKARTYYDKARNTYFSLYTNNLQEGTFDDANFWKSQAIIVRRLLHKPKKKEDKNLLDLTDSYLKAGDELLLKTKYGEASILFQRAFNQYNTLYKSML